MVVLWVEFLDFLILEFQDLHHCTVSTECEFYLNEILGTKIVQYCTCPAGRVTYNFHSSCKHMHLSFKSVCNKGHKRVICNTTSSNYSSFLDFTRNYERTSGIFVPPNLIIFTVLRQKQMLRVATMKKVS